MEDHNDEVKVDKKEKLEEKTFEYDEKREHLDWEQIRIDFSDWLDEKPSDPKTRFMRFQTTLFHIFMAVLTGGTYLAIYMMYYLYKFSQTVSKKDYKRTSYIKKLEDGEEVVEDSE